MPFAALCIPVITIRPIASAKIEKDFTRGSWNNLEAIEAAISLYGPSVASIEAKTRLDDIRLRNG
jgi:hypothetical protein